MIAISFRGHMRADTLYSRLQRAADFARRYVYAVGLVAHAFTIGLRSRKRRHLVARLADEANYPRTPAILPVVGIDSITRGDTGVVLQHPRADEGNVSLLELLVLARIVRERAPKTLFEIGTFNGRTTVNLAANAPDRAVVYTLDLPANHPTRIDVLQDERKYIDKPSSGDLIRTSAHSARVVQLFGDSAAFDFSPYEADFVFVDGSHAYEYVMSDSQRALAMLPRGTGVVVWHDYGEWDGVTRALNELYARDARFRSLRRIEGTALAILAI